MFIAHYGGCKLILKYKILLSFKLPYLVNLILYHHLCLSYLKCIDCKNQIKIKNKNIKNLQLKNIK